MSYKFTFAQFSKWVKNQPDNTPISNLSGGTCIGHLFLKTQGVKSFLLNTMDYHCYGDVVKSVEGFTNWAGGEKKFAIFAAKTVGELKPLLS